MPAAPFCAACLLVPAGRADSQKRTGASHAHLSPGTQVGRYEILERLGEGGFAEVYSARPLPGAPVVGQADGSVALKILKRGMNSREILARFQAEQRAVRALSHPSIVPLFEAGFTGDGLPFFAMAQVDGLPVTEHCQAGGLTLADRLRLFLPLCDAVQHAHQRGVLHRDLKPANILVEETADGPVPKVIDFGIAKALEPGGSGETRATQLGLVLGTPTYMSPEQAEGRDEADTRSDIYALGAVLYEMLTDQPPFEGQALGRLRPGEWARHLREHPPALPSTRLQTASPAGARTLRGSLDLIVRKAMASEPDRRYAAAAALAEDVQAALEDRPISARPPTLRELSRQFVRRHRWPVAVAASVFLGIVATAGIGTVLAVQARRAEGKAHQAEARALAERNRALAAEQMAGEARERSDRQNYQAAIEVAAIHLARGEPYLAADRLRNTPAPLRGWEWGYLMATIIQPEAVAGSGLDDPGPLAATPDGSVAAVAAGNTFVVVDVRQNRPLCHRVLEGNVERLTLSSDGRRVAAIEAGPGGGTLRVFLVAGGEEWSLPLPATADMAWEPAATGGALLLVCGNGPTPAPGRLARLEAGTGRVLNERSITRWKVHGQSLTIGLAGRMAVAENSYKDLEILSLPDLRPLGTDSSDTGDAADAILLDDVKNRLVVARGSRVFAGPATGSPVQPSGVLAAPSTGTLPTSPPRSAQVRRLNFLPDGRWIATGNDLGLVEGEAAARTLPVGNAANAVPLTSGRLLVSLQSGRLEVRPELPEPGPGQAVRPFFGGDYAEGRATAFTPDSHRVLFQSWVRDRLESVPVDRSPTLGNPEPAARLPRQPEAEWSVLPAVLADGTALVRDGAGLAAVRPTGAASPLPVPHTGGAWSADGSPDGRLLAVGVPTGVRLLDGKTHAVVREWPLAGGPFRVLLPATDPTHPPAVLALGRDSILHYLPLEGAPAAWPLPLRVNGFYPAPLAFHRDGGLLAGGLEGGGFAVYDLRSLPAAPRLRRRCASAPVVSALGFAPGARRLAVGTLDHRLTLWDWPQALPLLEFPLNSTCASVAFSPDGEFLAYTDYDPSLILRRAEPRPSGR